MPALASRISGLHDDPIFDQRELSFLHRPVAKSLRMAELIKILREVIGARPLVPLVLILLVAFLFKTLKDYPIRALLHDRWFLSVALIIAAGSVVYFLLTSAPAARTPEGRLGVYVARLQNDSTHKVRVRLVAALKANIEVKASTIPIRVEFRDLNQELSDPDPQTLHSIASKLNAAVIIWGTAVSEKDVYSRSWVENIGSIVDKSAEPIDLTDLQKLATHSSALWHQLYRVASGRKSTARAPDDSITQLQIEVQRLKSELAELRTLTRGTAAVVHSSLSVPQTTAILVGVAKYTGAPSLNGPRNDVGALSDILKKRNKKS